MLTSFFPYCDVQLVSDTLSEFLIKKYKLGTLNRADPVSLSNDFLSEQQWISNICRKDVGCAAEVLTIVTRAVKSPYYIIPDSVIKQSV